MLGHGADRRRVLLVMSAAVVVSGCTGGSPERPSQDSGGSTDARRGGTLTLLTQADQIEHLDPQRIYNGEDAAFASAYLHRALVGYKPTQDRTEATALVPDLATDTGTPSDGATTWTFTLKEGPSFEDGSPITCSDVKYGVSRTFATDVIDGGPGYAISLLDIPTAADGYSVYKGPFITRGNDVAAFDRAVECSADADAGIANAEHPAL